MFFILIYNIHFFTILLIGIILFGSGFLFGLILTRIKNNKHNNIINNFTEQEFIKPGGIKVQNDVYNLFKRKLVSFEYNLAKKNAELEKREKKQNKILDALSDGIYMCSPDYKIEYLNKGMINNIGYSAIGKTCYKTIYNLDEKCDWCVYGLLDEKKEISYEIYNDNLNKHFSVKSILLDNGSKLSIYYDISHRKKAERELKLSELKYKTLVEDSSIGVGIFMGGKIIYTNDSLAKIFGLKKASDLINKNILDFLTENSRKKIRKRLENISADNFVSPDLIIKINKANNTLRTLKLRVSDLSFNNENYRHATFMDITEQIEADKELRNSQKILKENLIQKDKFFSIIAHDLKNPFNTLLGFIELLKLNHKKYDDTKREEILNLLESDSKKIHELLSNLLLWARSQQNKLKILAENIDVNEIVTYNINLFGQTSKNKNITISSSSDNHLVVHADKNMISTVIRNLLSNAIKFTKAGGSIYVKANKLNDNLIEIIIEDTGVGINQENLNMLFRIDQGFSTEGTEYEQGSGLGLILCKEFVEKNGGQIHAESTIGVGSKFIFTIPQKTTIN